MRRGSRRLEIDERGDVRVGRRFWSTSGHVFGSSTSGEYKAFVKVLARVQVPRSRGSLTRTLPYQYIGELKCLFQHKLGDEERLLAAVEVHQVYFDPGHPFPYTTSSSPKKIKVFCAKDLNAFVGRTEMEDSRQYFYWSNNSSCHTLSVPIASIPFDNELRHIYSL